MDFVRVILESNFSPIAKVVFRNYYFLTQERERESSFSEFSTILCNVVSLVIMSSYDFVFQRIFVK